MGSRGKTILFIFCFFIPLLFIVGCKNDSTFRAKNFANVRLLIGENNRDIDIKGDSWNVLSAEQIILQVLDLSETSDSYCSLGNSAKVAGVDAWTAVYNSTSQVSAWNMLPKNLVLSQGKWAVRVLVKLFASDVENGADIDDVTAVLDPLMSYGSYGWEKANTNESNNSPEGEFLNPGSMTYITLKKTLPQSDLEVGLSVDVTAAMSYVLNDSYSTGDMVLDLSVDGEQSGNSFVRINGVDNSSDADNTVRFLSAENQKITIPYDVENTDGKHVLNVSIRRKTGENEYSDQDKSVEIYFYAFEGMELKIDGEFTEGKFVRFSFDTYEITVGEITQAYLSMEDNPLQYEPLYIEDDEADYVPSLAVFIPGIAVKRVSDGKYLSSISANPTSSSNWVFSDGVSYFSSEDYENNVTIDWAVEKGATSSDVMGSTDISNSIFVDEDGDLISTYYGQNNNMISGAKARSLFEFRPIEDWELYYDENNPDFENNLEFNDEHPAYRDGGNFTVTCTICVPLPDSDSNNQELHTTVYSVRTSKNFILEQMSPNATDNIASGRRYRLINFN